MSTPASAGRSRPPTTSPSTFATVTRPTAREWRSSTRTTPGASASTPSRSLARSNQFARALTTLGVARGDRVGIVLPQRPETAVAHLAAYKLGAVALPLSTLFGPDALEYRLRDAGAKVVVTDGENLERVLAVAKGLPALVGVVCVDRADADGVVEYAKAIDGVSDSLEPVA